MCWSRNCTETALSGAPSSHGECRQGNQGSVCRSPFPAALAPGGSAGLRGAGGFSDQEGKQGSLVHRVLGNSQMEDDSADICSQESSTGSAAPSVPARCVLPSGGTFSETTHSLVVLIPAQDEG